MIEHSKINWFYEIQKDASKLPRCLEYYNERYNEIQPLTEVKGRLSSEEAQLGYITSIVQSDWATLDALYENFNILLKQQRSQLYKKYLETYQRSLTSNDVKNYIDGEPAIVSLQQILNEINLTRNKFIGLSKGFESKNFQLNNLTKIKSMGLDLVEM